MPAFEFGNFCLQANKVGPTLVSIFLSLWENAFNIFLLNGRMSVFRHLILPAFEFGNIFLQANNVGPTMDLPSFLYFCRCGKMHLIFFFYKVECPYSDF